MKKRMISSAAICLFTLVLLVVSILGFHFSMVRGSPIVDVRIENLVLEDGRFSMTASQGENSGTAFRQSSYEIQNSALYVTLYSGLVYGNFNRDRLDVNIQDDGLRGIQQVYLRGDSAAKLIYSK